MSESSLYLFRIICRLVIVFPFFYFLIQVDNIKYRQQEFVFPVTILILATFMFYLLDVTAVNSLDLFFYVWPLVFLFTGLKKYFCEQKRKTDALKLINCGLLFAIGHIFYFYYSGNTILSTREIIHFLPGAIAVFFFALFLVIKLFVMK